MPSADPPTSSVSSVVQVRRYSWRSYAKNVAYEKRREFVGTNKQINTNSSLFPPQKPLVSRVHLTNVVRKIGQQERSKAPAPRTRSLGSTVARFARPFESRPVDPVRRECYRQLAERCTAVSTGWLAPSGYLATTPPPLDQGQEDRSQSYLPPLKKGRRKKRVLE